MDLFLFDTKRYRFFSQEECSIINTKTQWFRIEIKEEDEIAFSSYSCDFHRYLRKIKMSSFKAEKIFIEVIRLPLGINARGQEEYLLSTPGEPTTKNTQAHSIYQIPPKRPTESPKKSEISKSSVEKISLRQE